MDKVVDLSKTAYKFLPKQGEIDRLLKQIENKVLRFGKVSDVMVTVNYNFELHLFMEQAQEEHVAQFRQIKQAGKDLLDSIAILSQRRLPRGLFSDD